MLHRTKKRSSSSLLNQVDNAVEDYGLFPTPWFRTAGTIVCVYKERTPCKLGAYAEYAPNTCESMGLWPTQEPEAQPSRNPAAGGQN